MKLTEVNHYQTPEILFEGLFGKKPKGRSALDLIMEIRHKLKNLPDAMSSFIKVVDDVVIQDYKTFKHKEISGEQEVPSHKMTDKKFRNVIKKLPDHRHDYILQRIERAVKPFLKNKEPAAT